MTEMDHPVDKLTHDCLLHFFSKLNQNDVDVLSVVDRKFNSIADDARSSARLMDGKELKIAEIYFDKIHASVFIANESDTDMETELYHTASKHANCKQCDELNDKDYFNTPDIERNFVKWWTTRYLFNKITLCFKLELQLDDILSLIKDNFPPPRKYPIESLDISFVLGQSNRISEFREWILFLKPQNLRNCISLLNRNNSNFEFGEFLDFVNKLALSVDQDKESSLELSFSHYSSEYVTIESSITTNCNFLLIYNNFSTDIICFSVDVILSYAVKRSQMNKSGQWSVMTTTEINVRNIIDAMALSMEGRRAEGMQRDCEYQVFEGARKIFSVKCNYYLEDVPEGIVYRSKYKNTIRFY